MRLMTWRALSIWPYLPRAAGRTSRQGMRFLPRCSVASKMTKLKATLEKQFAIL